jgi:hypothetical protein
MIQGLHASSVVFADFNSVSSNLLANLNSRMPGINTAGYPVRLQGAEYRMRLGLLHWEKRDLLANLDLMFNDGSSQPQLTGTVRLQEAPKQARIKVTFEGRCARNFGMQSSAETTEAVRHLANDSSRSLLEMLVTALEASTNGSAGAHAGPTPIVGRAAKSAPKPVRKTVTARKASAHGVTGRPSA